MKKVLLSILCVAGLQLISAQTYCTPAFPNGCNFGDVIDSFEIPMAGFYHSNSGCSANSYEDNSATVITMSRGLGNVYTVTHDFGNQYVKIWVDLNNDGVFTDAAPELLSEEINQYDPNTSTPFTSGTIFLPATTPLGNYRLRVATKYDENPIPCNADGYGEAEDYTLTVIETPTCLPPTNVSSSNITANGANVSWAAPTSTVGVNYEYILSTSPTQPAANATATGNVASTALSVPLSSLLDNTQYYFWVRSVCSATDKSLWSARISFTTLCANVVPTYTENFDTGLSVCWSQVSGGSASTPPTGTDELWIEDSFLNSVGGSPSMRINLYYEQRAGWLKTVPVNLSAGNYQVKFDYGLTDYANEDPSAMGSDDLIQFLVSTNGGTTWDVLKEWTLANSPSNTNSQFVYDLASYTGDNTVFAFYGTDGTTDDVEDYDFFVENFVVEPKAIMSTTEVDVKKNLNVYPNPFTDYVNIMNVEKVKSISVVDVSGKLVKSFPKPEARLNMSDLSSGMYMIILQMNDGTKQSMKIIKK